MNEPMSLKLYFHPLSSFCQKVLVALYENDTPFEPHIVNLFEEASSAASRKFGPSASSPYSATTRGIGRFRSRASSSSTCSSTIRERRDSYPRTRSSRGKCVFTTDFSTCT